MKLNQKKSITIVVEETVLNGKDKFGNSNDLMFIAQALRDGYDVYLITPEQLALQNSAYVKALKLAAIESARIDLATQQVLHDQSLNYFLARPANLSEEQSNHGKIFFEGITEIEIDLTKMPVFNRAEPISLNDGFYEILMRLKAHGVLIKPDPSLNKILGDKIAVKAIHYREKVGDLDLLEGVDTSDNKNQISFATGIKSISTEQLGSKAIAEFYENLTKILDDSLLRENFIDLLNGEKYEEALELVYPQILDKKNELLNELIKLYNGAQECLKYHNEFGQDTILKPANYFGGCGVKRMQGEVSVLEIMQHFCQIFADIKADCIKRQGDNTNLASLPSVIVQKRATEASFGDLRIVVSYGQLQGVFVRINPKFAETGVGNISQGGHPESLFKGYDLSHDGIDTMINDMLTNGVDAQSDEIRRAQALYGLLEKINFVRNLEIFKQYPIIGIDALLTKNADGSYRYGINEINLTSPSGQTALMVFDLVYLHQELATQILQNAGLIAEDAVRTYQILPDIFVKVADVDPIISQAKTVLGENEILREAIFHSVSAMIYDSSRNLAKQSLDGLQLEFEQHQPPTPPSQLSPRATSVVSSATKFK